MIIMRHFHSGYEVMHIIHKMLSIYVEYFGIYLFCSQNEFPIPLILFDFYFGIFNETLYFIASRLPTKCRLPPSCSSNFPFDVQTLDLLQCS